MKTSTDKSGHRRFGPPLPLHETLAARGESYEPGGKGSFALVCRIPDASWSTDRLEEHLEMLHELIKDGVDPIWVAHNIQLATKILADRGVGDAPA